MKKIVFGMLIVVLALIAAAWLAPQEQEEKLLPSEVQQKINSDVREYAKSLSDDKKLIGQAWIAKRAEFAKKNIPLMQTEGLDRQETYICASVFTMARMHDEAAKIYAELAKGDDLLARNAGKQIIYHAMDTSADMARKLLDEYRSRFPPSSEDLSGLYDATNWLAQEYAKLGDMANAVAVIKDELAHIGAETPQRSWDLIGQFTNYLDNKNAKTEASKYYEKLKTICEARKDPAELPGEEREAYEQETIQWNRRLESVTYSFNRIKALDSPAPGLNFTHFLNCEPMQLADLHGKVVVLDFWANWCDPCIATFPETRRMYAKYQGTDVQIIGVTGFQGSMTNHGAEPVEDITQEVELELTKKFIEYQKVTWPVAFSARGVNDIEYGISAIPVIVVIDKKGYVRMFERPMNNDKIIAMIEKLRAE